MNTLKPRSSSCPPKLIKHQKRDNLKDKIIARRVSNASPFKAYDMTFDEMLEAASLFDSLLNGASYVNQTSVSPKARIFVQRNHEKYKEDLQSLRDVYKKLNRKIVVANHGRHYADPKSKSLYKQVMRTSK